MPDATPVVPPADPTAGQTAPSAPAPVTVTSVAVLPIQDAAGGSTGYAAILEEAGDVYIVSYYDAATNLFYTGADSADANLAYVATPELDALMVAFGSSGNRDTLPRTGEGLVVFASAPQGVIDGPSGGILPVVPRYPYLPDALRVCLAGTEYNW